MGSHGLDVGCGSGLQCHPIAEAVGPGGHVTGLDIATEFLEVGEQLAKEAGLGDRISFKEGSAESIPFDDDTFDWVWSVDCVGYGPWEPIPLLEEMRRVTKPGGILAILAWSSERLLPGYPMIEAKLGATSPGIAPASKDMPPNRHFHRALGWFRELGLRGLRAEVFSGSAHAPLGDEIRNALEQMIAMRWVDVENELAEGDLAEYNRLCKSDSLDFILDHPDYYAFFTYSMFYGQVL
ncbi:MAG: methyltransferase domain-containing protein [Deltaproteobacteria bacterium]|nr:methyltransferase domain-containing protein [Deltaproteobacteria bacterium]